MFYTRKEKNKTKYNKRTVANCVSAYNLKHHIFKYILAHIVESTKQRGIRRKDLISQQRNTRYAFCDDTKLTRCQIRGEKGAKAFASQ